MKHAFALPTDRAGTVDEIIAAWSADLPSELSAIPQDDANTVLDDLLSKGLVKGVGDEVRAQVLSGLNKVPGLDANAAFDRAVHAYLRNHYPFSAQSTTAPAVSVGNRIVLVNGTVLVILRVDDRLCWGHRPKSPTPTEPFPTHAVRKVLSAVTDPKQPRVIKLAERFLQAHFTINSCLSLRYWREGFYHFRPDTGAYTEIPDVDIRAKVTGWLKIASPQMVDAAGAVLNVVAAEGVAHIPCAIEPPVWIDGGLFKPAHDHIAFANGILDIQALRKGRDDAETFHPASPLFFSLSGRQYSFDEDARCDSWLVFLEKMLPSQELRDLLQEVFGYIQIPTTSFQRLFLLFGPGANGKGVVSDVLAAVVGAGNVCSVPLSRFGERFSVWPLTTCLLNLVAEMPVPDGQSNFRIAEDKLKAIVSGDYIEVERKHKDILKARATARLVFSANELPPIADRSNGVWRRLIIIPFSVIVPDAEQDINLAKKLIAEELPGIFNWALEGLLRLLDRGHFVEPEVCRELKMNHRRACAPEEEFLAEHVTVGTDADFVVIKVLYNAYRTTTTAAGHYPISMRRFVDSLKRLFSSCKEERRTVDGGRVRGYTGIKFNPGGNPEGDA